MSQEHSIASSTSRWRTRSLRQLFGRRRLMAAAIILAAAGTFLGRDWLGALGVPLALLSLAPCLAMCALGFCMRGRDCQSGAK